MKLKFFIFIFAVCTGSGFAQDTDISVLANYLQKARYQDAIEYIDRQEASKELLYEKAFCHKSLNDFSKAIVILDSLSRECPNDVPIKLQLALCYESGGFFLKGAACYEDLIQTDSVNTYFKVRKADLLYRAEKYSTALEEYAGITDYNPNYLNKCIAVCYDKINRPDSAKLYFAQAWEADAGDSFSALSLVKLHIKQENYPAALEASQKFISVDSANLQMNILNAYTYYNLNAYEKAALLFEKCRLQGDSSLLLNRSLGISYYFLKADSLALPYLQQAYSQDTTNNSVLYALAAVSYDVGNYSDAIRYYNTLAEKAKPNGNALFTYYKGLGKSYQKSGLYVEAVRTYILAVPYIPSNEKGMELYYDLATLLENELKSYHEAGIYYKQYRLSLFNYQNSLTDEKEINDIELKLNELDKHIQNLKDLTNNN